MKAALTYGPFDIRVEDIPEPTPGPGEVKVKIAYCGICGSDPEIYEGTFGLLKAPWWPPAPFSTGHEASGTIVELGPGLLGDWKVGQRVAMNFRDYCGACYYCQQQDGAVLRARDLLRGGLRRVRAVLGELPLSAARRRQLRAGRHARAGDHRRARGRPGQHPARARPWPSRGGGTIGLLVQQVAMQAGAARVLVSDPMPEKRAHGQEVRRRLDRRPAQRGPGGRGHEAHRRPRASTRCSSAAATSGRAQQTIDLADKYGTVVWAGVVPRGGRRSRSTLTSCSRNELTVRSTILAPYVFPRALKLLSKLDLEPHDHRDRAPGRHRQGAGRAARRAPPSRSW